MEAGLGHGYTLKDQTYEQTVTFIREDRTDKNEYVEDTYVCSHFARDVCNNAEEEGFRCAFVEIRYSDGGHAIIAFDTIDEGLVYFDAITDERIRPAVGKRYYRCIEPSPRLLLRTTFV
jgi:5-formaminoimidazole-4-carboxamide-1-beta-D-ribofuranosyl 5'-monophosphate synthetase